MEYSTKAPERMRRKPQKSRLQALMETYKLSAEKLEANPCLENALKANLASINAIDILNQIERLSGAVPSQYMELFKKYSNKCLGVYDFMIKQDEHPESDHIGIYREQIAGRIRILRQMFSF